MSNETPNLNLPPSGCARHWPNEPIQTFVPPEVKAAIRAYAKQHKQVLREAIHELLVAGLAASGAPVVVPPRRKRRTRYTPEQLAALAVRNAELDARHARRAAMAAEAAERREKRRIAREQREAEAAARRARCTPRRLESWLANAAKARAAKARKDQGGE